VNAVWRQIVMWNVLLLQDWLRVRDVTEERADLCVSNFVVFRNKCRRADAVALVKKSRTRT
jgi:hypothetical protein